MLKPRTLLRGSGLFVLVLIAAVLLVVHPRYPILYISKVLIDQNPEYSDIHDFPASSIAASEDPIELPVALDPRVLRVFEEHPDLESFEAFLDDTETSAFLVVHGGRLVVERYLMGHDEESLQNTFSVSKSVTSALVGLALRNGVIEFDAPVTRYLPELLERDERFAQITVKHLLDMQSGIRYDHDVTFPIVDSDDPLIYYHPDLESVVAASSSTSHPSTTPCSSGTGQGEETGATSIGRRCSTSWPSGSEAHGHQIHPMTADPNAPGHPSATGAILQPPVTQKEPVFEHA